MKSSEEELEHEKTLAKIESQRLAFEKSPCWFTIWDISCKILHIIFWVLFWTIVAQCRCNCIIK